MIKLFLFLTSSLFSLSAWGQSGPTCSEIFHIQKVERNVEFLHVKFPWLFQSSTVEKRVERGLKSAVHITNTPEAKLAFWLEGLKPVIENKRYHKIIKTRILQKMTIKPEQIPAAYIEERVRQLGYDETQGAITERVIENIIEAQKSSLSEWIDYLLEAESADYPISLRLWVLDGVFKLGNYSSQKGLFSKRGKSQVNPFTELNPEALILVLEKVVEKLKSLGLEKLSPKDLRSQLGPIDFGKMYGAALKLLDSYSFDPSVTSGEWRSFPRKGDPASLLASLKGKNTGWCILRPSTAKFYLDRGDIHIYFSQDANGKNTVPRLAITQNGGMIDEVRGRGEHQNIDPYILRSEVLQAKLSVLGRIPEQIQTRLQHMNTLSEIETKVHNEISLSNHELSFLYQIDGFIQGFGTKPDPRIQELITLRSPQEDLARILDLRPDQISFNEQEALSGNAVYHFGDLHLSQPPEPKGLRLPEFIHGDLIIKGLTRAKGVVLPRSVSGDFKLPDLRSFDETPMPERVGKSLDLRSLQVFKNVKFPDWVGGNIYLDNMTRAKGWIRPRYLGGQTSYRVLHDERW